MTSGAAASRERSTTAGVRRWPPGALRFAPRHWLVVGLLAHAGLVGVLLVPRGMWGAAAVLALAEALPVLWARRYPVLALSAHLAVKPLTYLWRMPVGELAWLVLIHSVGRYRGPRVALPVLAGTALLVPVLLAACFPAHAITTGVLVGLVQLVAAWALGFGTRLADEREQRARRDGERERLHRSLAAERATIGAELHEIVEKQVRRILAGTTELRRGRPPGAEPLRGLHQECGAALSSLRCMLGLLRTDVPDAPAPRPERRRVERPPGSPHDDVLVMLGAVVTAVVLHLSAPPGLAADALVISTLFALPSTPHLPDTAIGLALVLLQILPLGWRNRFPVTALLVTTAGVALGPAAAANSVVGHLCWFALAYSVGARGLPRSVPAVGAAVLAWMAGSAFLAGAADEAGAGSQLYGALLVGGLAVAGNVHRRIRAARHSAERAEQDHRIHEELRRERSRLACEVHDQVSHHVSGMVVQAGAARALAGSRPEGVDEALREIEDSAELALRALPRLLDVLGPEPTGPTRLDGIELEHLVRPLRDLGARVRAELAGDPRRTAGDRAELGCRVVQEAVRNVIRHAGPTATRVRVEHHPAHLLVEVADAGAVAGHHRADPGCGQGLAGLGERVELVGGRLRAGPRGSGWRVTALLPLRSGSSAGRKPEPITAAAEPEMVLGDEVSGRRRP
ncbi:sensor histidine kinase [Saccharopolyspora sp. CA-218241]|uniref:sensor histidine kinase n=1 Tax=Saccharopolyspora sp. CA-218241 TaxID=3240027 RepID=UPI003D9687B5